MSPRALLVTLCVLLVGTTSANAAQPAAGTDA